MATVAEVITHVQQHVRRHEPLRSIMANVRQSMEHIRRYGSGRWSFDFGEATVDTVTQYTTGTVGVSGTTVTGSGTTFTSAMSGRIIRVGGIRLGAVTYVSATSLTLDEAVLDTIATGTSYVLYRDTYPLDGDGANDVRTVERIWDDTNQRTLYAITSLRNKTIEAENDLAGSDICQYYSLEGRDESTMNPRIRLWPRPSTHARLRYWYAKRYTVPTSPSTTVDLPSYMDETVKQGALAYALKALRDPQWREEFAFFEDMIRGHWEDDQPLRDLVIKFKRMDSGYPTVLWQNYSLNPGIVVEP